MRNSYAGFAPAACLAQHTSMCVAIFSPTWSVAKVLPWIKIYYHVVYELAKSLASTNSATKPKIKNMLHYVLLRQML